MPLAEVAGLRLRYQLQGPENAPVVALSNSLGTDLSMWEPQAAALSSHLRVLRYDMRGQGESSVLKDETAIDIFAQDFIALIDVLGLRQVSFCGLSMGGMIGMWLGIHAHDRLNALVLSNTAARIGTKGMWDARIARVRQGGMRSVSESVIERWFTPEFRVARPQTVKAARNAGGIARRRVCFVLHGDSRYGSGRCDLKDSNTHSGYWGSDGRGNSAERR